MKSFRNKHAKLAVVVIGYNSKIFLKTCFDSIKKQTIARHLDIIYIDNISHDDSVQFVYEKYPHVRMFQNHFNFGYAGAANQGIDLSAAPFVNIINPDIILEPDYFENILKAMSRSEKIAAASGKLLRYDFEKGEKTNIIDTTGLVFHRSTRVTDRGQGEQDEKQYDQSKEVWGVSGACPIYRRTALNEIKKSGEALDSSFFMYKEDVDLAWRLNTAGYRAIYVPKAVAYHGRGTGAVKRSGLFGLLRGRNQLSKFQKYYSFHNHQKMLRKNLTIRDFLSNPFAITTYEVVSILNAAKEGVLFGRMNL
ncbi:hypothetical protein CO082_02290 [Candidatus Peregrinibacteria bacterium CG_4_9_14_0_8_um_filter_44_15]|nr:MAG: hypothetical protein CO082_02290 [Candidatus Peregrinibacteria bacterium CG_4_9_14_0_8_um_filter_44_15]